MLQSMSVKKDKRCMGFVSAKASDSANKQSVYEPESDTLVAFDEGESISFADASHNMITLGTTGSGKTMQIVLPAACSLIKAGFGGLIVDVKGNFTNYVRMIAREYGRLDDVVEFGPGPDATPVNLLYGTTVFELEQLVRSLMSIKHDESHHAIFFEEGIAKALDVLELYRIMCIKLGRSFHFEVFNNLLNDYVLAQKVYEFYDSKLKDLDNLDEKRLVGRINGDTLHYILPPGRDLNKRSKAYDEQNSYRMGYVRTGVERFMRAPGMVRNFLGSVNENLDIARRIYDENKIVVLRLANETGHMGEVMANFIRREYYKAVFRNGKRLPQGKYTFLIADEVQDFFHSDREDQYNDNSFVAKCREFRNISIFGTQSVVAMQASAAGGLPDCEAFVANCNVRVFLFSDDPNTQALAPRTLPDLETLPSGKANLAKFDVKTRDHVVGTVGLGKAYAMLQDIIERQTPFVPDSVVVDMSDPTKEEKDAALKLIVEENAWLTGENSPKEPEDTPKEESSEENTPQPEATVPASISLGMGSNQQLIRRAMLLIDEVIERLCENNAVNEYDEPFSINQFELHEHFREVIYQGLPEKRQIEEQLSAEMKQEQEFRKKCGALRESFMQNEPIKSLPAMEANGKFVRNLFPEFFTADEGKVLLPDGWVTDLCWHMSVMRVQGLSMRIRNMHPGFIAKYSRPMLYCDFENSGDEGGKYLQRTFNGFCLTHCMFCGKPMMSERYQLGFCKVHEWTLGQEGLVPPTARMLKRNEV